MNASGPDTADACWVDRQVGARRGILRRNVPKCYGSWHCEKDVKGLVDPPPDKGDRPSFTEPTRLV